MIQVNMEAKDIDVYIDRKQAQISISGRNGESFTLIVRRNDIEYLAEQIQEKLTIRKDDDCGIYSIRNY